MFKIQFIRHKSIDTRSVSGNNAVSSPQPSTEKYTLTTVLFELYFGYKDVGQLYFVLCEAQEATCKKQKQKQKQNK